MLVAEDDVMRERLDALSLAIDARIREFDRGGRLAMLREALAKERERRRQSPVSNRQAVAQNLSDLIERLDLDARKAALSRWP